MCFLSGIAGNSGSDFSTPAAGAAWQYLVTGGNSTGEGALGFDSAGVERPDTSPCL
jgi:hypothetical protein